MMSVPETDCVWSKRERLLLDCSNGTKENRNKGDQTVVRQARLARQRVHSEGSSVAFCRSIDVELARGRLQTIFFQKTSL